MYPYPVQYVHKYINMDTYRRDVVVYICFLCMLMSLSPYPHNYTNIKVAGFPHLVTSCAPIHHEIRSLDSLACLLEAAR